MGYSNHNDHTDVPIWRRVFSIPTLISFVVALSFIGFLLTRYTFDWDATWGNIRSMNLWMYFLAFLLYYLSFLFRGLRWKVLALNADRTPSKCLQLPPVSRLSQLIIVGCFVNCITWLRIGDAYRAYKFSEESNSIFSWSLGTVLAERVLDTATIFAILMVSAAFITTTTMEVDASTYILIAAFMMVTILLLFVLFMRTLGNKLAHHLPVRLENAYYRFQQGTLGSFKQLRLLLTLGLLGWLLEIGRLYFVIMALDLNIELTLIPVVALGHGILSAIPTPGGVGAVEPGVTGLLMLSLERHDAVSVTLVDRSITYVSVILIGGLIFLVSQFRRSKGKSKRSILVIND